MPRKSLITFIAVVFAVALGLNQAFSQERYYEDLDTFTNIMSTVMKNYVDEEKADPEKLFEGAYRGMLQTLDPYTQYFNVTETKSFNASTKGEFGGLGIEISLTNGVLSVISPIRDTPAFEAGILAGDAILEIDGESTARITLQEAVERLRGEVGSPVTLTVRHPGSMVDSKITITRAIISPSSVQFEMIDEEAGIGYAQVSSFTEKMMDDLRKSMKDTPNGNIKGLILDLRGNPGGLLNQAVEMCDEFLSEGVVVSIRGRAPTPPKTYRALPGQPLEKTSLVLLTDMGSASASEIVAGAMRDHRRALIVGTQTYGKGSVQNIIPLGDGAALKLTTARYYTPNDTPIEDHNGIVPDIIVPMTRDHMIALRNQEREDKLRGTYHVGGLIEGEEMLPQPKDEAEPKPDEEVEEERRNRVVDIQLKAAYNILKWQLECGSPTAAK